jgi:hypothetical protein
MRSVATRHSRRALRRWTAEGQMGLHLEVDEAFLASASLGALVRQCRGRATPPHNDVTEAWRWLPHWLLDSLVLNPDPRVFRWAITVTQPDDSDSSTALAAAALDNGRIAYAAFIARWEDHTLDGYWRDVCGAPHTAAGALMFRRLVQRFAPVLMGDEDTDTIDTDCPVHAAFLRARFGLAVTLVGEN